MPMRLAFAGDVTMDFFSRDFARAGHDVLVLPGFGAWRQDFLALDGKIASFNPDAVFLINLRRDEWSQKAKAALGAKIFEPPLGILEKETPSFRDAKMEKLAAFPFSLAAVKAMEEEFEWFLECKAPARAYKILALDADDTLWRGIASEGPVEENGELQKTALALKSRGVGLVLLSKNAPKTVEEALKPMTLSPQDFLCFGDGVNYRPKAENLRKICAKLNVGPDSVVFLDDRPRERAEMKMRLPEVAVPPFPSSAVRRRLETYFFPAAPLTQEDILRNESYASREKRANLKAGAASEKEFLASLDLRISPSIAKAADVPRLSQLSLRTNQFNSTGVRRSEESFAGLLQEDGAKVFVFRASDRFGDMGLVCYMVARNGGGNAWRIAEIAMSCRAMGLKIEDFALEYVKNAISEAGGTICGIDFIPTPRNTPFAEWLSKVSDFQIV